MNSNLDIVSRLDEKRWPATVARPGEERYSSAERWGELIAETMRLDPSFYLFSPDETTSNRLEAAYDVTARAWARLLREPWDLPEATDGRIVELLSENTLFATMVGHNLTGGQGVMASYEAFFTIVASQLNQYLKFLKQKQSVAWREDTPGLNLLSTSVCWRQDHNGFSHQSPAMISLLLSNPCRMANVLLPADDVAATAAYQYILDSRNVVNLVTFDKNELPRWIDRNHAVYQYEQGASVLGFASDDGEPDYVLVAAGDIATREVVRAVEMLRAELPGRKFRVINIAALSYGAIGTVERPMSTAQFDEMFTRERPIIACFHGYPGALREILVNYAHPLRLQVHGFCEEGSTTTPMEMLRLNHASRYDLCIDVCRREGREDLVEKFMRVLQENTEYAREYGVDKIVL
ncbi:hypothetical protein IKD60_03120 [Candidatus Saccharibacteria bacterium]|nr:hypothetical protein [Candidatus Saccharibacteria bacterium]